MVISARLLVNNFLWWKEKSRANARAIIESQQSGRDVRKETHTRVRGYQKCVLTRTYSIYHLRMDSKKACNNAGHVGHRLSSVHVLPLISLAVGNLCGRRCIRRRRWLRNTNPRSEVFLNGNKNSCDQNRPLDLESFSRKMANFFREVWGRCTILWSLLWKFGGEKLERFRGKYERKISHNSSWIWKIVNAD